MTGTAAQTESRLGPVAILLFGAMLAMAAALAATSHGPADSLWNSLAVATVFAPVLLTGGAWLALRIAGRRRGAVAAVLGIDLAAAALIAVFMLNGRDDAAPAVTHELQVVDLYQAEGRDGPTYHVTVAPWGPELRNRRTFTVSRERYAGTHVGGVLPVATKPGAYGIEWIVGVVPAGSRR